MYDGVSLTSFPPSIAVATGPIRLDADGDRARSLLAGLLARALGGVTVEVRTALTYSELLGWLGRREVHVAWIGPALLVHAQSRFGVEPLARVVREGRASFRGALFVRDDAAARSVEELRGKRVAWVDPDSCSGFLFPRIALAQRGHDPDRLFGGLRILGSHAAVARAVAEGQADVGATHVELLDPDDAGSRIVRSGWSAVDVPMRAVLITDPVPGDVLVATREVEASARARLRDALTSLHETSEGATILGTLFQAGSLVAADASDYAAVRDAMRAAGVRV